MNDFTGNCTCGHPADDHAPGALGRNTRCLTAGCSCRRYRLCSDMPAQLTVAQFPLALHHKEGVRAFLAQHVFERHQYDYSYHHWLRGGRGWQRTFGSGGTDIMSALMWYHHVHKPESNEWRPSVIMRALCNAAGCSVEEKISTSAGER